MEDSQPQSVAPPSNPPPSTQPLTGGASGGGHGGPVAFITPDFGILVDATVAECPAGCQLGISTCIEAPQDWKETGAENWSSNWFECFNDLPLCLCTYCCPCAVIGRTFATVSGKPCEAHCCSICCICFVGLCYLVAYRTKIREKYNIKGSKGMDCVLSCCCAICTICQEAQEVQKREASFPKPFGEKTAEPAYQSMNK